jgi:hypothetical protein
LFVQRKRFTLAPADGSVARFPLRSGDFPLQPAQDSDAPINPRRNHVVLRSERLGEIHSSSQGAPRVAENPDRPVIIR